MYSNKRSIVSSYSMSTRFTNATLRFTMNKYVLPGQRPDAIGRRIDNVRQKRAGISL